MTPRAGSWEMFPPPFAIRSSGTGLGSGAGVVIEEAHFRE